MAITNIHDINKTIAPTMVRTTITPDQAARLLERNENNRKFSPNAKRFRQLCRALTNGEWQFNGDAIRIDWNGRLIDGQHRLQAVVATGTPIDTILVEGLNPQSQETMDTGKARTVADFLSMRGEKNAAILAAVILRRSVADATTLKTAFGIGASVRTVSEQLAYFNDHPELREYAARGQAIRKNVALTGALAATLMVEFDRRDKEDSDYFWARLYDGAGLPDGSPILVLRNTLIRLRDKERGRLPETYLAALTIKAWNKYRRGETIGGLNYRVGGANPEKFPEVI